MALSTATITFDLADILGVDFKGGTKVWVDTNVPNDTIVDTIGNQIRLGSGTVEIAADGTGSMVVWVPGAGSNPASWQTTIHVDYRDSHAHGGRTRRDFGPYTITASANLADLVDEQEVPPTYISTLTAQLDEYATNAANSAAVAVAAADSATSITLGDADTALAAAVQTSGTATNSALATTISAATGPLSRGINVRDYGAKGDGTTNDTSAINAAATAWVAVLATGRAMPLVFPPGKYRVTSTITIAPAATGSTPIGGQIIGDGATLYLDSADTMGLVLSTDGAGKGWQRPSITGLHVDGGGIRLRAGNNSEFIWNAVIDRVHVTNAPSAALRLSGIFESQVLNSCFEVDAAVTPATDADSAIYVEKESGKAQPSSIDFTNVTTRGGYVSIRSPHSADVKITGGTLLAARREAVYLQGGQAQVVQGVHVENPWLDGTTGQGAIRVEGSGTVRGCTIISKAGASMAPHTGSSVVGYGVRGYVFGSDTVGTLIAGSLSVMDNVFQSNTGGAKDLQITGGQAGSKVIVRGVATKDYSTIASGRYIDLDNPSPAEVRLSAAQLVSVSGAPSLTNFSSIWPAWALDAASNESVAGVASIPPDWKAFDIVIEVFNGGAGAGAHVFRTLYSQRAAGDDAVNGFGTSAEVTTTALAANILQEVTLLSGQGVVAGKTTFMVRIDRRAAVAGDTLANDMALSSVILRRTA